jgi:hypothetical protein
MGAPSAAPPSAAAGGAVARLGVGVSGPGVRSAAGSFTAPLRVRPSGVFATVLYYTSNSTGSSTTVALQCAVRHRHRWCVRWTCGGDRGPPRDHSWHAHLPVTRRDTRRLGGLTTPSSCTRPSSKSTAALTCNSEVSQAGYLARARCHFSSRSSQAVAAPHSA